jgi:hypothetical protein
LVRSWRRASSRVTLEEPGRALAVGRDLLLARLQPGQGLTQLLLGARQLLFGLLLGARTELEVALALLELPPPRAQLPVGAIAPLEDLLLRLEQRGAPGLLRLAPRVA